MNDFRFNGKYLNQISALQVLIKLGYKYIPPSQAFKYRKGSLNNVLLENILDEQLRKQNRISYRKKEYAFSDENISIAINKLRRPSLDYITHANQKIYDLITLPQSVTQTIAGNTRSFDLFYIDCKNWQNNVYHCTSEYTVERSQCTKTARPDIVLFVNGIPLVVIECKPPKEKVDQAIFQQLHEQGREYLPHLFAYGQLLLALNKNQCKYATIGTPEKYLALWKEKNDTEVDIQSCLDRPLTIDEREALYTEDFGFIHTSFEGLEQKSIRTLTAQDRALFNLCRPDRLMDLTYRFTVFDESVNNESLMACEEASLYVAKATQGSLKQHWKVNFWRDIDAQSHVKSEIDDHLFDKVREELGVSLSENQMDALIENLMKIAKSRMDSRNTHPTHS